MTEQTTQRPPVAEGDSVRLVTVPGAEWRQGQVAEVREVDSYNGILVRCVDGASLIVSAWERVDGNGETPRDSADDAIGFWESKARAAESELAEFKTRVVDLAREIGRTQGWCEEGQREALTRLGLELPTDPILRRRRFTVTYTVEVSAVPANEPVANATVVDRACVQGFDGRQVRLDGCWTDAETHAVQVEVVAADREPPTTAPGPF